MKEEKKPLISVIVPVYQVEEYLELCVESICNQTYCNLEIILIDDGSKDACPKMCDEYAKKDERIVVIHKENGGLSSARNHGLDICKGSYITCVDSDDYIAEDMIERLYQVAADTSAEMVSCRWKNVYEDGRIMESSKQTDRIRLVEKEEALEIMLYQLDADVCAWGKLYKRELFAQERYLEGKLYEDFAIIFSLLERCHKVAFIDYDGYYYLQRSNSIMRVQFQRKKMDLIDFSENLYQHIRTEYPQLESAAACRAVRAHFTIYLQIPSGKEYKSERKRIEKNVKAYRKLVMHDRKAGMGTKLTLLVSYISFRLIYQMKGLKKLAKRQGQI